MKPRMQSVRIEDREHRELDLVRLDLLAEVLGRAADHEARDEDRQDDEEEHAVETGADAADDDLARGDVGERHEAADRRVGVVQELTAPQEASVVTVAKSVESPIPNRTSLPSMLPPVPPAVGSGRDAGLLVDRVAALLGDRRDDGPDQEQERHRREDGPAVPDRAGHPAERVRQARADREDQDDLEEVRPGRRVLVGMRGVGVEEAAAVGPELLDGLLRGDRALGDLLRRRPRPSSPRRPAGSSGRRRGRRRRARRGTRTAAGPRGSRACSRTRSCRCPSPSRGRCRG